MPLIPYSQVELSRVRRDIEKAMSSGDWSSVGQLDSKLDKIMDTATTDSNRDISSLLNEMGQLLNLYKQLMETCHERKRQLASEQSQ